MDCTQGTASVMRLRQCVLTVSSWTASLMVLPVGVGASGKAAGIGG